MLGLALFAVACDIDAALEGPQPPTPVRLDLALQATSLDVAPGDSATLGVSATRADSSHGKVTFSASVPSQFTVTVVPGATVGAITAATLTISAGPGVAPGTYFATVHVTADPAGSASVPLTLVVAPHPGIGVTPVKQLITLIPGGIAPLAVSVSRVVVTDPVALSLAAPPGITLAGTNSPVDSTTATLTLAVAAGVAPGTYPVTLRGSAPGVPDASAPLTVVVAPDPLQLITDDVATAQASLVTRSVIVNRNGAPGTVTLSADGLPSGVTFSAAPVAGTTAAMAIAVGAGAAPGAYLVTLRGSGAGATASTSFVLTIAASNVAMTLVPQDVAVLQGSSAASVLTLVRTSFGGAVSVQLAGVPDGISVEASDPTVTGATTTILVTASKDLRPGTYGLTVRAVPLPGSTGAPALDAVSAPLTVTVLEAPTTEGNVVLDWSRCTVPDWVAGQDGTGPWTRLAGVQGRFRFAVSSVRGGVAYSTGPTSLTVRFATGAELSAGAIDMCDPATPAVQLRTVTGTAQYPTTFANGLPYTWNFGGGNGGSSVDAPNFTILGVTPGTHDLVGVSLTSISSFVIVRDLTPSAAGSIGTIPVIGQFSLTAILGRVRVGATLAERLAITESYLTTAACTENDIYTTGISSPVTGSFTFTQVGIPAPFQRETDFHHIEASASSASGTRTATKSFHAVDADNTQSVDLPPNLPSYTIVTLPGTHQRLRLSMGAAPLGYTGDLTFQFSDGFSSVTVASSAAALATAGSGIFLLDMPELGATSGFPAGTVPPAGSHGTWSLTLTGSNGSANDCVEGAARWSNVRRGTF